MCWGPPAPWPPPATPNLTVILLTFDAAAVAVWLAGRLSDHSGGGGDRPARGPIHHVPMYHVSVRKGGKWPVVFPKHSDRWSASPRS